MTTVTHELRSTTHDGKHVKPFAVFSGTEKECKEEAQKRADDYEVGIGYILSNGGFSIVSLEDESIERIKSYGVELLRQLEIAVMHIKKIQKKYKPEIPFAIGGYVEIIKKAKGEI